MSLVLAEPFVQEIILSDGDITLKKDKDDNKENKQVRK